MQTVNTLIRDDYKTLDVEQTTQKALSSLDSSKDLVVVLQNGEYKGVITAEQILRHEVTDQGQKIKTVYKRAPRVDADETVVEALRLLYEDDLKVLPVFDDGSLTGVVHLNDVLDAVINDDTDLQANDLMTTEVTTVTPTTSTKHAVSALRDNKVSRLPVEDNGSVVGIISVYDIIRRFHKPQDRIEQSERNNEHTGLSNEEHSPFDAHVQSIMKQNLVTASPEAAMTTIIDKINDGVGSVLITKEDTLKGIITRRDIMRRLVQEYNEQSGDTITVTIATNIENIGRDELTSMIATFADKYSEQFGPGHITLHIKPMKNRRDGQRRLTGRLHVHCQEATHHITVEGFGPIQLTRNALRKLRTLIFKYHQDHDQMSTTEYFEQFDLTSL